MLRAAVTAHVVRPRAYYELMAELWLRSDVTPNSADFTRLEEALRAFPRHGGLIVSAALVHALHGHTDRARELVTLGLRSALEPPQRTTLLRLQSSLPSVPR